MDKITIELTKQELNTIIIFLERTQLSGKEAYTYVALITKLMAALNRPEEKPESAFMKPVEGKPV